MATSNWLNSLRSTRFFVFVVVFLIAFIFVTFYSLRNSKPGNSDTASTVIERSYQPVRGNDNSQSDAPETQPPTTAPDRGEDITRGSSGEVANTPSLDVFATMEFLQEIERDEQGKIIINTNTLRLLNRAVRTLEGHIDASMMAALAPLIEAELPGSEGEKATAIFTTYVEYKSAENDLIAQTGNAGFSSAELLEQTIALRRSYFGAEVADQLFKEEEQYLRDTIEAMENTAEETAQPDGAP